MGASSNGAIQILRFPTQRSNASRGDQSGTCEGEVPPSQGSYITRSWRPGIDMSTLWSSIHCADWTLRPLKVEASTTMTASHSSFTEVPSTGLQGAGQVDQHGETRPRHILVQFVNRQIKKLITKSLYKIKSLGTKFKHIVLAHDLAKKQRLECK